MSDLSLTEKSLIRRHHHMPFGAELSDRGVLFRLWAPKHATVSVKLEDTGTVYPMKPLAGGWHELQIAEAGPGTRYRFVLPDSVAVPDPASRFQPQDVHGASEVIAPNAYSWTDESWRGRGWEECVIYELHVGAFTADGTFRAAIERLDELRDLGITAIELMPVADFPGRWNWGYDGVLLFAPDSSYGRPEDFKRLVDAAHARGIAVILDVVYNHFGPDGNYLPLYSHIFTESHHTPWGAAVNYDAEHSESVRDLIINNAVYWIREYNLDGLRLDAFTPSSTKARSTFFTSLRRQCAKREGTVTSIFFWKTRRTRQVGWLGTVMSSLSNLRRSGTTTCITCCTPPRREKVPATTPIMSAIPISSAARSLRGSHFKAN